MAGAGGSSRFLPLSWFDELARIRTKVEDLGVWPDGLLDAYITMIPKTDGDAAPLGQRPLSVLPVVYRIWASARWVPDSVFSAGAVVDRLRPGILLLLTLKKFFLVLLIPMSTFLLLMLSSLLTRWIEVFWIESCLVLGFLAGFVMLILSTMLMFGWALSLHLALVSPGLGMGVFLRGAL